MDNTIKNASLIAGVLLVIGLTFIVMPSASTDDALAINDRDDTSDAQPAPDVQSAKIGSSSRSTRSTKASAKVEKTNEEKLAEVITRIKSETNEERETQFREHLAGESDEHILERHTWWAERLSELEDSIDENTANRETINAIRAEKGMEPEVSDSVESINHDTLDKMIWTVDLMEEELDNRGLEY